MRDRRFYIDIAERVFWTAVQAGLGAITVEALDVPAGYGILVAAVLATLKGFVAGRIGNRNSASTAVSV